MKKDYLYIFVHIPKTAGTTFRDHVLKNFKPDEVLNMGYEALGLKEDENEHSKILSAYKRHLDKLSNKNKKKIKFIQSHLVPYGIDKLIGKEARYITFFRNPEDRVISTYNYLVSVYDREKPWKKDQQFYKDQLLIDGKVPDFENWYWKKFGKSKREIVSSRLTDYFVKTGFLEKGKTGKKERKEFFNKFYFIGLVENFTEDSYYLYDVLGVKKFVVNKNKSKKFYNPQKKVHMEEKIRKDLKIAKEFYNDAINQNKKFKKENKDFYKKVKTTRIKRFFFLPITQLLFDFRYVLGRTSSLMRKIVPFYAKSYDFLKKKYDI